MNLIRKRTSQEVHDDKLISKPRTKQQHKTDLERVKSEEDMIRDHRELYKRNGERPGRNRLSRQEARVEGIRKTQRQRQAMLKRRKLQESSERSVLSAGAGATQDVFRALSNRFFGAESRYSEQGIEDLKILRSWLSLPLEMFDPNTTNHESECSIAGNVNGINVYEDKQHGLVLTLQTCELVVSIVLPYLVDHGEHEKLAQGVQVNALLEALWCVINLASFDQVSPVLAPCVPLLTPLLTCQISTIASQAAWALGNIAGESLDARTSLSVNSVVIERLRTLLDDPSRPEMVRTAAFALSNVLRGPNNSVMTAIQAGVHISVTKNLQFIMERPLDTSDDAMQLLSELSWVVVYLTAREDEAIQVLVNCGTFNVLLLLLSRYAVPNLIPVTAASLVPVLRAAGNVLSLHQLPLGDQVLSAESLGMRSLDQMLSEPTYELSHACTIEAAWCASQLFECLLVAAGPDSEKRLDVLLSGSGIVTKLSWLLSHSNYGVKGQVAIALHNFARHPDVRAVRTIIGNEVAASHTVESVLSLLDTGDLHLIEVGLDFVQILIDKLMLANGLSGAQLVEQCGGLETIENLIYADYPPQVGQKASTILDLCYEEDEEDFIVDTSESGSFEFQPSGVHMSNPQGLSASAPAPPSIGRGKALLKPSWAQ